MEFDKIIEKRRSVRNFKTKKAHWRDAVHAVNAAIHIPFAGNKNNLRFMMTETPSSIRKIADACEQDWIADSGIVIVICSEDSLLEDIYGERGRIYCRQQAGAATMTILYKLVDLGLAACWVGAFNDNKIRRVMDIPEHVNIEAVIPIGYEYGKTGAPRKRSLDTVMYWENWGIKRRPTIFAEPGIHDNP